MKIASQTLRKPNTLWPYVPPSFILVRDLTLFIPEKQSLLLLRTVLEALTYSDSFSLTNCKIHLQAYSQLEKLSAKVIFTGNSETSRKTVCTILIRNHISLEGNPAKVPLDSNPQPVFQWDHTAIKELKRRKEKEHLFPRC